MAINEKGKEFKLNYFQKLSKEFKYIVNHDKKQYIDKTDYKFIHPLSLITAEGNGRGGGDYQGSNEEKIGNWSRDIISIEKDLLPEYTKFEYKFSDY